MRNTFIEILGSRRLPLYLAVISILLVLPSMWSGLQLDDFFHWYYLTGHTGVDGKRIPATDMFHFVDGDSVRNRTLMDAGLLPWWSSKNLQVSFWRPLPGLTHWLDYRFWPENTYLMHVQSYLWFGLVIVMATLLYRRLNAVVFAESLPRKLNAGIFAAGLSALFFAIDDAHGLPAGWIANRNALIATFFGLATLLFHVRWREDRWKAGMAAGPIALALGLLSGEIVLGAGAFLVAYALCLDPGKRTSKLVSLVPYALIFLIWFLFHTLAGYGTTGSGFYVDPLRDPVRFLLDVLEKSPVLLLDQFAFPPSSPYIFLSPVAKAVLWAAGIVVVILLFFLFFRIVRENSTARFFTVGILLSVLPVCATVPHSRLLFFTGFGAMGLIGIWIDRYRSGAGIFSPGRPWGKVGRVVFVFFVAVHGVIAPLLLPLNSLGATTAEEFVQEPVKRMDLGREIERKTLIVVTAPLFFYAQWIPTILLYEGRPYPLRLRVLAPGTGEVRITRTDDHSLLIAREEGWLNSPFDDVYRDAASPLRPGNMIQIAGLRIDVRKSTPDGRPSEVLFSFSSPLEDTAFVWITWENNEYKSFSPPRVGESVRITVESPYL